MRGKGGSDVRDKYNMKLQSYVKAKMRADDRTRRLEEILRQKELVINRLLEENTKLQTELRRRSGDYNDEILRLINE